MFSCIFDKVKRELGGKVFEKFLKIKHEFNSFEYLKKPCLSLLMEGTCSGVSRTPDPLHQSAKYLLGAEAKVNGL